jgi:hypothetical protein
MEDDQRVGRFGDRYMDLQICRNGMKRSSCDLYSDTGNTYVMCATPKLSDCLVGSPTDTFKKYSSELMALCGEGCYVRCCQTILERITAQQQRYQAVHMQ